MLGRFLGLFGLLFAGTRHDFAGRVRNPDLAGAYVGEPANRLYNRQACSRSATASVKPGSARAWSSPTSSGRRRSARSTCARSRTSSSSCCPRRRTSRGSSTRTPSSSASTGSSTSTSTTRATSRGRKRSRSGPAGAHRGPRNRRLESSVVLVTLVGIAVVFGLVIAAWKSGDDSPNANAPIADTGLRAPAERVLVVRGTRGATRMEVRRNSQEGELVFSGTIPNGREQSFGSGRSSGSTCNARRPSTWSSTGVRRARRHACSSSTPRASSARPPRIDAAPGAARRHRQRARPR